MNKINIKILSDECIDYMKNNIKTITKNIKENPNNDWIYNEFPQPIFIDKKFQIDDFDLKQNDDSKDKDIDIENSINIYNSLKHLPRYIITSEGFWLWLYLEKFYKIVKGMMTINGESTITDHWMFKGGNRRGLMFGVLSRCYFRVALTVDEDREDKYELTRWTIKNPERFRNLTWSSFSSELHLVQGILSGEKKAVEELNYEINSVYTIIAKYINELGSVRLLDTISKKDIEKFVYDKMLELLKTNQ